MDFFKKITKNPYENLYWNIPEEKKIGKVAIMGGNSQTFRVPIKMAEYLMNSFPLETVQTVLPDTLKAELPSLNNLIFLKSIGAGSFSEAEEIKKVINCSDFTLIVGDLSKNTVTKKAVTSALQISKKPVIVARDTIDLIAEEHGLENILMNSQLILMGSILQWRKIFKAIYYPKLLQPSQSLMQIAEAFHKFTLSYPVQVITLHEGQILICKNGQVIAVPLEKSGYSPVTIWNGELSAKILAINFYNPEKFLDATVSALFFR